MKTQNKLDEMIVHVAQSCMWQQLWGRIKLNKILFFADALAFTRTGATISGGDYIKKQFGPVLDGIDTILEQLEYAGRVSSFDRSMPDGSVQRRLMTKEQADLTAFSRDELGIVTEVIAWISPMSAMEISELSHEMVGWDSAHMDERIPITTVLIPATQPALTIAQEEQAMNLSRKLAAGDIEFAA